MDGGHCEPCIIWVKECRLEQERDIFQAKFYMDQTDLLVRMESQQGQLERSEGITVC